MQSYDPDQPNGTPIRHPRPVNLKPIQLWLSNIGRRGETTHIEDEASDRDSETMWDPSDTEPKQDEALLTNRVFFHIDPATGLWDDRPDGGDASFGNPEALSMDPGDLQGAWILPVQKGAQTSTAPSYPSGQNLDLLQSFPQVTQFSNDHSFPPPDTFAGPNAYADQVEMPTTAYYSAADQQPPRTDDHDSRVFMPEGPGTIFAPSDFYPSLATSVDSLQQALEDQLGIASANKSLTPGPSVGIDDVHEDMEQSVIEEMYIAAFSWLSTSDADQQIQDYSHR